MKKLALLILLLCSAGLLLLITFIYNRPIHSVMDGNVRMVSAKATYDGVDLSYRRDGRFGEVEIEDGYAYIQLLCGEEKVFIQTSGNFHNGIDMVDIDTERCPQLGSPSGVPFRVINTSLGIWFNCAPQCVLSNESEIDGALLVDLGRVKGAPEGFVIYTYDRNSYVRQ